MQFFANQLSQAGCPRASQQCPHCQGCARPHKHGGYYRWRGMTGGRKEFVQRYICPLCRRTWSVLPAGMMPYSRMETARLEQLLDERLEVTGGGARPPPADESEKACIRRALKRLSERIPLLCGLLGQQSKRSGERLPSGSPKGERSESNARAWKQGHPRLLVGLARAWLDGRYPRPVGPRLQDFTFGVLPQFAAELAAGKPPRCPRLTLWATAPQTTRVGKGPVMGENPPRHAKTDTQTQRKSGASALRGHLSHQNPARRGHPAGPMPAGRFLAPMARRGRSLLCRPHHRTPAR